METFELCFRVTVDCDKIKPYPVIENLPPEQRAIRVLENTVAEPLRWLTGVDDVTDFKITKVTDERVATDAVGTGSAEVGPAAGSSET